MKLWKKELFKKKQNIKFDYLQENSLSFTYYLKIQFNLQKIQFETQNLKYFEIINELLKFKKTTVNRALKK